MAVLQMNKICICAVKEDRKKILEFLQRQGCIEVSDTAAADEIFRKTDTSSVCATLKKASEAARACSEIMNRYCPAKRSITDMLKGPKRASVKESDDFCARRNGVLNTAQHIVSLERSIHEAKTELLRLDALEKSLFPWMSLPVPQAFKGTKKTAVFIGSVGGENTFDSLTARLAGALPELDAFHVEIVSASKEQTCFYMAVLKEDAQKAEEALRAIGFAAPSNPSRHMPKIKKEHIIKQKQETLELIRQAELEIKSYEAMREEFRFLEDHMKMREEKYGVIERLMQSRHAFVLTGYIPERDSEQLRQAITGRFDCAVELESAADDADAPVMLQNTGFSEPVESVLESYSMPGRGELDPTPVMSIFYYIMFGLMFSDAGYGLIMAGVCGACLLLFRDMKDSMKKNLRLFFWCGVSTIFWGVMFSSYFGDVVNVFSRTFLGHETGIPPVWFAPLDSPMKLLVFCLGIGVVHLLAAYAMKACNQAKNRQYIDIVYDAVFPVAILLGLLALLMNSDMFLNMAGFRLSLSAAASSACLWIAAACMLGVVLTGGRESKSWFKRILKGLYALYNVLAGWLGDILSYSRLLALGLATGVIASVINSLGTMSGGGVPGFIIFVLVFLVGHAMNFGINVLGAYVHSNRLEYVEFFGKFYEGGSRKFLPYGIHTKYYLIREEDCNV
ncbi:MAG TPA: V-type ATP synthase subunit I [Feifaniaceae bacterium]|nr:V-type ATP synthase subunit I [Feifaniaceae bacterium]